MASDILTLGGVTSGTPYVLDMQYASSAPGGAVASLNGGTWDLNATDGNTGNNASGSELGYIGSFANFQAGLGDTNLNDYLGAYGYDPVAHEAWAVLDHASSFAVVAVPEPGTLAMLAVCAGPAGLRLAETEVTTTPLLSRGEG